MRGLFEKQTKAENKARVCLAIVCDLEVIVVPGWQKTSNCEGF